MVNWGNFSNNSDIDGFGVEFEQTADERNKEIHKKNIAFICMGIILLSPAFLHTFTKLTLLAISIPLISS